MFHRAYTQQDGGRSTLGRKTGRLTMRSVHDAALPSRPRGQRELLLLGLLSVGLSSSSVTFVALAAPVVAMAPNTRIGASSPIDSSGGNLPSSLDTKIKNDLEADIRSLQTSYGRNVELAVSTVESAKAYDDTEAIDGHLGT